MSFNRRREFERHLDEGGQRVRECFAYEITLPRPCQTESVFMAQSGCAIKMTTGETGLTARQQGKDAELRTRN